MRPQLNCFGNASCSRDALDKMAAALKDVQGAPQSSTIAFSSLKMRAPNWDDEEEAILIAAYQEERHLLEGKAASSGGILGRPSKKAKAVALERIAERVRS